VDADRAPLQAHAGELRAELDARANRHVRAPLRRPGQPADPVFSGPGALVSG
jgi:hypothetical protein